MFVHFEEPMKISDAKLEMELGGVDTADIAEIVGLFKGKNVVSGDHLDTELVKRGYEKMFSIDYDTYEDDEYDDWEDDDFASIEKFPHKQSYRD